MTEQSPGNESDRLHERAYRILSGDDSDERACAAIPDSACTRLPANYLLNVANGAATKLAEQIASPGLVLPWLMAAIGAPAMFATLFVPIKQIGSLLPQLAVAGAIRGVGRRKWVWAGAGITQAVMLALLAVAALTLSPVAAGGAAIVLFAIFCIASGAGSVAFQDVVGKTIPKGTRGRMLANRALVGGLLALAAATLLKNADSHADDGLRLTIMLILVAAALWAIGALFFAVIHEAPGATQGGRSMISELRGGFELARTVNWFRQYLLVRALLLAVELAMPLFVLQSGQLGAASAGDLPVYVFAVALSAVISSPFWGRFADSAAERVMALSGLIGAAAGIGILALPWLAPAATTSWTLAIFFVLLGIAESGIRLGGRKTYLVDRAPAAERALYTAFSNTAIGILAIAGFALVVIADAVSPGLAISVIIALALAGALAARALPPADRLIGQGTT